MLAIECTAQNRIGSGGWIVIEHPLQAIVQFTAIEFLQIFVRFPSTLQTKSFPVIFRIVQQSVAVYDISDLPAANTKIQKLVGGAENVLWFPYQFFTVH